MGIFFSNFRSMIHQFKQREWEKLLIPSIRFRFTYWLLKKVGLIFLTGIFALFGILLTILIFMFAI